METMNTLIRLMDRKDLEKLAALTLSNVESARNLHEWYMAQAEEYGREEDMIFSNKYLDEALTASKEYALICERLDQIRNENRVFWPL